MRCADHYIFLVWIGVGILAGCKRGTTHANFGLLDPTRLFSTARGEMIANSIVLRLRKPWQTGLREAATCTI